MSKSYLLLFFIPLLLTSCNKTIVIVEDEKKDYSTQKITHNYDEIVDMKIYWSSIFSQKEDHYYVYLYSTSCTHCNSIKDAIIEYALEETSNIYFVSSSAEHNLSETVDKYAIVDSLDELYSRGYPSLLKLEEHVVTLNLAGVRDIIDELDLKI